jgi:glycosyltransferase involved in cell wall biosynthesis
MTSVAHVVSSLEIGGAERLVIDLACAQLRTGMAAWIVDLGQREEAPLASTARALGLRVVRAGRWRSRATRLAQLARLLAGRRQALHIHNPGALRAVLPILPAARGRVIYTRHGAFPYASTPWRLVHRVALPFVDHVTFVTEEARRAFEQVHGASRDRHIVVENGVVVGPGREAPRTDRLRIGCVGRLVELKGQYRLLDAVANLGDPSKVEVHLFGDGPERDRLVAQAQRLRLPVTFHGMVLDREQIYAAIDVLVVASRTEGQSMAIMEAMACSLPVIATDVGGNADLVRDGGLLVRPNDVIAIRDALARLLDEPELHGRLGRAGHAWVRAHHSIDNVAECYRALYAA